MVVVEKKRSKGGFLNLFDWPGKSRKKLFSGSSELSEEPRQGKENVGNVSKSRFAAIELDETRTNSSYNPRSDLSCASSVTSDEGHGTRAPSVVARLMGLDSLPVPNASEPRFNPGLDPFFLRNSQYANTWNGYESPGYVNCSSDVDGVSWNHLESRMSKRHNRPIERFQTETLPPKSAKPIPISHNRLLSPIRSPGFVPSRNPAYIMEAASRIIEPSPRVITRTKVSPVGSSSVPLRIRDLKEKLEAAHKASSPQIPNDIRNGKYPRGNHNEKINTVSATTVAATKLSGKGVSEGLKGKGKSSSVSAQAKVNINKRDGSTSSVGNNRNSTSRKERVNAKNRVVKSQSDMQRNGHKGTSVNMSKSALRQNNQKQNCRDSQAAKSSVPNLQSKKVINKVVNKVLVESETGSASKRFGSSATRAEKDVSLFRQNNLSRSRKSANGVHEERACDDLPIRRGEKLVKCNIAIDGDTISSKDNRKKDMDVISFMFSSPIKGISSDPQSAGLGMERDTYSAAGSFSATSTCTTSFNVIGGDSLNVLLEQKLRELACKIESSSCNLIREESSGSTLKELMPFANGANGIISSPSKHDKWIQNSVDKGASESASVSECTSVDDQPHCDFNRKILKKIMQSEEAEEHEVCSVSTDAGIEADYRHPSPASDLGLSCSKSCSDIRYNVDGIKQSLSAQEDQKELSWGFQNEPSPGEDETEFSETASSIISMGTTFTFLESKDQPNWELEYINEILNTNQLMLKEFALGITQDVIPSSLLDERDTRGNPTATIERKMLFDCVRHCLALKCEKIFTGSCERLKKHGILFERKDWLAEELYREMQGLKNMGEMMVDELVDKDMSSLEGKWIDHEKEAYEEGIEIERVILSSLVDDLVSDLLSRF